MVNVNAAIALGLSLGVAPHPCLAEQAKRTWHFTVLLDGKRIGVHDFTVARDGDQITVDNAAHFNVVVAFITVYVYDHRTHETWRSGCLTSIDSETNENGRHVFVRGQPKAQAFEVQSSHGAHTLPACSQSFAYWDPQLLAATHLLNAQTGEYQPVTFAAADAQDVAVAGQKVAARHYTLRGPKVAIDVWYSPAGEWIALESKVESGKLLRYEIH